jgi:hypothetical protein
LFADYAERGYPQITLNWDIRRLRGLRGFSQDRGEQPGRRELTGVSS